MVTRKKQHENESKRNAEAPAPREVARTEAAEEIGVSPDLMLIDANTSPETQGDNVGLKRKLDGTAVHTDGENETPLTSVTHMGAEGAMEPIMEDRASGQIGAQVAAQAPALSSTLADSIAANKLIRNATLSAASPQENNLKVNQTRQDLTT
jgi:hypothetical protein